MIKFLDTEPVNGGRIGIQVLHADSCRFRDVILKKTVGEVFFRDDFSHGLDKWERITGKWDIEHSECVAKENDAMLLTSELGWQDYSFEMKIKMQNFVKNTPFFSPFIVDKKHPPSFSSMRLIFSRGLKSILFFRRRFLAF